MTEGTGQVFVVLFVTLGFLILVWFWKITQFFSYLRENHPEEYQRMGEPTLVLNNTPKNNIAFLRFVLGNKSAALGDLELKRHCKILRVIFYTCSAVFLLQLIMVLGAGVVSS